MLKLLKNLKIARFDFDLRAKDTIIVPAYKGSIFRGGFGQVFKEVACNMVKKEKDPIDCKGCPLQPKCIYSAVFESPIDKEKAQIMKKYPFSPHPFILEPPYDPKRIYQPGDKMTMGLVLIGKAIDYVPYFIYTFERLGEIGIGRKDGHQDRGQYILSEVKAIDRSKDSKPVYSWPTRRLSNDIPRVDLSEICHGSFSHPADYIRLLFQSPVRLKYNEKYINDDIEFHVIIRNLLRRISTLSAFFGQTGLSTDFSEVDFKGIINKAEEIKTQNNQLRWYDWERYSNRQKTSMKLGGLIGTVDFQGNIEYFLPLLRAGEILHVGKGSSFGLGKYSIISKADGNHS